MSGPFLLSVVPFSPLAAFFFAAAEPCACAEADPCACAEARGLAFGEAVLCPQTIPGKKPITRNQITLLLFTGRYLLRALLLQLIPIIDNQADVLHHFTLARLSIEHGAVPGQAEIRARDDHRIVCR